MKYYKGPHCIYNDTSNIDILSIVVKFGLVLLLSLSSVFAVEGRSPFSSSISSSMLRWKNYNQQQKRRSYQQQQKQQQQSNHYHYDVIHSLTGGGTSSSSSNLNKNNNNSISIENNDGSSIVNDPNIIRSLYVRSELYRRYQYVISGKRTKDLMKWLKSRDGDATIFSMHGRQMMTTSPMPTMPMTTSTSQHEQQQEEIDNINTATGMEYTYATPILYHVHEPTSLHKKDPFPIDRLNLDLIVSPNTPNNCFHLTSNKNTIFQNNKRKQYYYQLLNDDLLYPPNIIKLVLRTLQLILYNFLYVWSTSFLAIINKPFRKHIWYQLLVNAMGTSGAAYIKWGQWASTRHDMFPSDLCTALSTLHNNAPSHSYEYTKLCIEKSLGISNINDVFDIIHTEPIASGSVAQVHYGTICNIPVAIKVRHPNVAQLIDIDFRIMQYFVVLIETILPYITKWLHLSDSLKQFSHVMAGQALLHVEAHHLELFNVNFLNWKNVHFPKPIYSSTSVIIETYEKGIITPTLLKQYQNIANHIIEQKQQKTMNHNNNKRLKKSSSSLLMASDIVPIPLAKYVVTSGVGIYFKMLLLDNLMHADLHPGNMLIHTKPNMNPSEREFRKNSLIPFDYSNYNNITNNKSLPPLSLSWNDYISVCLVDAGMVAQLTDDEAFIYIGLLASIGVGDGKQAAQFALQFSIDQRLTIQQQQAFINDMIILFTERCHGYGTNVDLGNVLRGVLGKHKVRVDANFATLVVNALCLQGLAYDVCPEYNVLDSAKPLLEAYRQLCLTKDGKPKRNAQKSRFVRYYLMSMYIQKRILDQKFFVKLSKTRKISNNNKLIT